VLTGGREGRWGQEKQTRPRTAARRGKMIWHAVWMNARVLRRVRGVALFLNADPTACRATKKKCSVSTLGLGVSLRKQQGREATVDHAA
jgi:hypothetical protein